MECFLSLSLSLHVCISRCRYTVHFQSILLKYAVCIKHIIEKHLWRWRWMSVQNILFSRRSIPFSMFHFATTVFFHLLLFIFGWMLLFALQLKIYNICLFGCALLFATDWIHFFAHKNIHTHTHTTVHAVSIWLFFSPGKDLFDYWVRSGVLMAGFVNIKYWKSLFFLFLSSLDIFLLEV